MPTPLFTPLCRALRHIPQGASCTIFPLCACGFEQLYHTLGHPHRFPGPTPSCHSFQDRHTICSRRTAGRGGAIVVPYDTRHSP